MGFAHAAFFFDPYSGIIVLYASGPAQATEFSALRR